VTLPFVDERYFLTMIQLVLPLHAVGDRATVVEPAADPAPAVAGPAPAATGATSTETSCLCVRV
jgi:hypothetical protein